MGGIDRRIAGIPGVGESAAVGNRATVALGAGRFSPERERCGPRAVATPTAPGAALRRLAAWVATHGQKLDDEDTGPYCKAQARLPESALHRLMRQLGAQTSQGASEVWLWCRRRVKLVDGSTAIMDDTLANQKAYPQLSSQKPGLGFPIARFVVIWFTM